MHKIKIVSQLVIGIKLDLSDTYTTDTYCISYINNIFYFYNFVFLLYLGEDQLIILTFSESLSSV